LLALASAALALEAALLALARDRVVEPEGIVDELIALLLLVAKQRIVGFEAPRVGHSAVSGVSGARGPARLCR